MEQLFTTFGVNWKLLVIQAVNFTVLLTALSYFLYRPLMKVLDDRKATIAKGIEDAKEADRMLSSAETERNSVLAKAGGEAEHIVMSAKDTADKKAASIVGDAEARAEALLADAQKRGDEAARRVMAETEAEIARSAVLAAEKILLARSVASEGGRQKAA
jgi:F-type H+-transporting ATPase subunit b